MGFSKFGKLLEGKGDLASMQLTFSMIDATTMSIMTAFRTGKDIVCVPLVITGSFEEINKEFFATVAGYQAKLDGFRSNMDALDAEFKAAEEAAKKKIADKKASASAKSPVKPVVTSIPKKAESNGSEPVGVQRGLFATLSSKADAGIAAEGEGEGDGENTEGFTEEVETADELEV